MYVSSVELSTGNNSIQISKNKLQTNHLKNSEINFKGKEKYLMSSLAAIATFFQASILGMKKAGANDRQDILNHLENAKNENPKFINTLQSKYHESINNNGEAENVRDYSDETILVLHKYNKENPKLAYYLAKVSQNLENDSQLLTSEETEKIALAMKDNLDSVQKLQYKGAPKDTLKIIELYANAPKETIELKQLGFNPNGIRSLTNDYTKSPVAVRDLAGMEFDSEEIGILFKSYCEFPYSVKSLAGIKGYLSKHYFRAADIAKMSKNYEKNKESISELLSKPDFTPKYGKYNGKFVASIIDNYREYPDIINNYLKIFPYISEDDVNQLVKLTLSDSKLVDMAIEAEDEKCRKPSNVIDFVTKSIENKKYFCALEDKNNNNKSLSIEDMRRFNTISAKDKKYVDMILADNRANSVNDILELIPVYKKYEGQQITDEMIAIAKDPLSELFAL